MTRTPARLLAALVIVTLLVSALPAPAVAEGSASFADGDVTVTRGDEVEITVTHSDTAHVYVGSERTGFLLEVVLTGAGTDTFSIDTYGTTGRASTYVSGASNVTLHTPQLDEPLAATRYLMNVTVGGVEQDLGSLTVRPRGEMNASARVAPATLGETGDGKASLTAGGAVDGSVRGRNLTPGDTAVFVFNESGLETAFDPADLDGDRGANGIAVRFTELDPPPNTEPTTFYATDRQSVTVLPALDSDRIVFVWDTSNLPIPPKSDHTWRMEVLLRGDANGLVSENTTVASARVDITPAWIRLNDAGTVTLYPWENPVVTVRGTTNLVPGTTLNVRARSTDPAFLVQSDVTVTANRTFSTTLDLAEAPPGTSVPIWVLGYRTPTERTVVRYDDNASISFPNQVSSGSALSLPRVYLGAGGFVTFHANNTIIGVTGHLAPGTHRNLTVTLNDPLTADATVTAVAHTDRNLNETYDPATDAPYVVGNQTVTETAAVTLQGSDVTTTPATTTTSSTTTTMSTTTTTTTPLAATGPLVERTPLPAAAAASSGVSVPFPAWTAVVALLGAGVLAARSRGDA